MKHLYAILTNVHRNSTKLLLLAILLVSTSFYSFSQVRVPFTPRQSTNPNSPGTTVYSIRGDFTMTGNTNLKLIDQTQEQNGNNLMEYVDVDNDINTINSSSAYISFSNENGAVQECSNVIFAGLYWTGRSILDSNEPFDVTREIPTGTTVFQQTTERLTIRNGQGIIPNTDYTLTITDSGGNDSDMTYTFTSSGSGDTVSFIHRNNGGNQLLDVSINGAPPTRLLTETDGDNVRERSANLNSPFLIFNNLTADSGFRIELDGLNRNDNNGDPNSINTSAIINVTFFDDVPETTTISNTLDKSKVSIKYGNGTYQEVTANDGDIFFPVNADGSMFSAFAEVTDIVRANGIGKYTVADIALVEGNGGGTGFYGGWAMVVVYENNVMNFRDVTVFDGHAFIASATDEQIVNVSGFTAVQNGPVGVKLGVIAGEGDRPIQGDFFDVVRQDNNNDRFVRLDRDGNTSNVNSTSGNFFDSSIQGDPNVTNPSGTRIPELDNNAGLDIGIFNVENPNNRIINNNQTSAQFRYGSTGDTYIIFNITFSVDAIVPAAEGIVTTDGVSVSDSEVEPAETLDYRFDIRNRGIEAIDNTLITIPIPFTATYVPNSLQFEDSNQLRIPRDVNSVPIFDPNLGANGSIVWDLGTLPLARNVNDILASFTFSLRATDQCFILLNANCDPEIIITGELSGIGELSQSSFTTGLIQGFEEDSNCIGRPITEPLITPIVNVADFVAKNCPSSNDLSVFVFCNDPENTTIPYSNIVDVTSNDLNRYPDGFRFFNLPNPADVPTPNSLIEYTQTTGFPIITGTTTYYAVPDVVFDLPVNSSNSNCYFEFTITILPPLEDESINVINVSCFGENDGSINLTINGGSTGNAGNTNLTFAWTGPNGFISDTQNLSNLAPGTYQVTVTDTSGIGCSTTTEATITEPSQISIDVSGDSLSCFGDSDGNVSGTVSGGTAPYIITLSGSVNGAPPTQEITGDGGSFDFPGLGAGSYSVRVTDSNFDLNNGSGCQNVVNNIEIIESDLVLPPISSGDITECATQPLQTLDANDAITSTDGISILWFDAPTGGNIVDSPTLNTIGSVTFYAEASNDTTNCNSISRTQVTLTINPAAQTPISSGDITECATQPLQTLDANEAITSTDGISILWFDAPTGGNIVDSPILNTIGSVTFYAEASNDTTNCNSISRTQVTLTINETPILSIESQTDVDCSNEIGGIIVVSATGGTAPYTYTINDANNTIQDNGTFSNLAADTYTITVTDSNGCIDNIVNIVIDVTLSDAELVTGDACVNDGIVDLNRFITNQTSGGIWEFTSSTVGTAILNGNDFDPSDLPLGNYVFTYTVTADTGCIETLELTLNINDDCIVLPCSPGDIVISKAVTPNGDQYNQFFTITGLETCGFTMRVQIFNRWGSLIFQSNDYQNNWSGESSDNSVGSSNRVPSGTYYYIVTLQNSGFNPVQGPIYVGTR